jgi:RimJ/RimL family protein N-acetyltransferase
MSERVTKIHYLKDNFPRLKIILAHSGRKWPFSGDDVIETIIPQLKHYDNLYFDTSTIRDSNTIENMVNSIGSERILFGSDFPYRKDLKENVYDLEIQTVDLADISNQDKDNIFRKNFKRLFFKSHWIRRCSRTDRDAVLTLIDNIPQKERKYLAIDKKMPIIRQELRNERHLYVLEDREGIQGFLRESGRSNNGAVIEEIYINNQSRGKGYGHLLLKVVCDKFNYLEAKTFKENNAIAALFSKSGFKIEKRSPQGTILYWKKLNVKD